MPDRPVLPSSVVDGYKRDRVVAAVYELTGASADLGEASIGNLVTTAKIARATLYKLFSGRDEAIAYALRQAIGTAVDAVEEGGVEGLVQWAEADANRVRFLLLLGPSIERGEIYGEALRETGKLLTGGSVDGIAVVGGGAQVVARALREGRDPDRELVEEAVAWANHFVPINREEQQHNG